MADWRPEASKSGKPPNVPQSHAVAQVQELLDYLIHTLAETSERNLNAIHARIQGAHAERKTRKGGPTRGYAKSQDLRYNWWRARDKNYLPPWDYLVEPWAFAYGGERAVAVARRKWAAIVEAQREGVDAGQRDRGGQARPPGSDGSAMGQLTGNPAGDAWLAGARDTLAAIARHKNPLFRRAVSRELDRWRDGVVEVNDTNYEQVLEQAYRDAQRIRASNWKFMGWLDPFGRKLIQAHAANDGTTTRVFIFDSLADALSAASRHVMFEHVLIRAEVRVLCLDISPSVRPTPGRVWDFAIIGDDEELIFETIHRGPGEPLGAMLYFDHREVSHYYSDVFEKLVNNSDEYGEFLVEHSSGWDLTGMVRDLAALLRVCGHAGVAGTLAAESAGLDLSEGQSPPATMLRRLQAICRTRLPGKLLPDEDEASSADSTYAYLRRQVELTARAELTRLR